MRLTFLLLCRHNHQNVVSAALRAVGNIVTGDDPQTQLILNCNALPCILHLLSSPKETIRKEACWTVSNIAAGNREQIQAVIDASIFPVLIDILHKAEFKTRKEAAWAVTNATSGGTPEQIKYLVSGKTPADGVGNVNFNPSFVWFSGIDWLHCSHVRSTDSARLQYCPSRSEWS